MNSGHLDDLTVAYQAAMSACRGAAVLLQRVGDDWDVAPTAAHHAAVIAALVATLPVLNHCLLTLDRWRDAAAAVVAPHLLDQIDAARAEYAGYVHRCRASLEAHDPGGGHASRVPT